MMYRLFILLALIIISNVSPASAQMDGGGLFGAPDSEEVDEGEEPALEVPELPDAALQNNAQQAPRLIPNSTEAYFPALPPSRLCTKNDIVGLWKLMMVFENPTGIELSDYSASPFQYFIFEKDDTFASFKGSQSPGSDTNVLNKLRSNRSKVLEQFVMHDSGVLYFYKDGVSYDSLACFIAANKLDPFSVGQMLLMPPPDKANVRMVRVYQKVYTAAEQGTRKNKKKKKKR
ncbi:MAG: hypothetical protein ACK502_01735 [Alphaproteobacteria bacterium]